MELHTASEVISFAKKLESDSAQFYEILSQRYLQDAVTFLSFAKENKNNVTAIERAYYGVITDAIESCFAFNMDPENYEFKTELTEKVSHSDALTKAVQIEQQIVKFYSDAAEQSKSLMADVPRTFTIVAKKRAKRESQLRSFL